MIGKPAGKIGVIAIAKMIETIANARSLFFSRRGHNRPKNAAGTVVQLGGGAASGGGCGRQI